MIKSSSDTSSGGVGFFSPLKKSSLPQRDYTSLSIYTYFRSVLCHLRSVLVSF